MQCDAHTGKFRDKCQRQVEALLEKSVISFRRRWVWQVVELFFPLFLASPFAVGWVCGIETEVQAKSGVDRAVHLGDPFDTRYAARLCTGRSFFALAPPGQLERDFRKFLKARYSSRRMWPALKTFNGSAADLDEYVMSADYGSSAKPPLCGALIFNSSDEYVLRLNGTITGNRGAVCGGVDTRRVTSVRAIDAKMTSHDWYSCSGFLAWQRLADEFLFARKGNRSWKLDIDMLPFPTSAHRSQTMLSAARELIALSVVLFFAYAVAQATGQIVAEREQKRFELMRLVGLDETSYFVAKLISHFIQFALYGANIGISLSLFLFKTSGGLLLVLFFVLGGIATAAFGLCVSALFDTAKTASLAVAVGFLALSRISLESVWACLFPPVALVQGLARFVDLELIDVELSVKGLLSEHLHTACVLCVLALDVPLYLLLGYYLHLVVSCHMGAAPSAWRRQRGDAGRQSGASGTGIVCPVTRKRVAPEAAKIVEDTLPVACTVEVQKVRKEYRVEGRGKGRRVIAVRSLDLGFAEGEILALLGHNGAGKSTTVGLLTGVLQPTQGCVTVYGHNVSTRPAVARSYLGVCQQHDVLFDDLSASQHLHLAAQLRGVNPDATSAAHRLLQDAGLHGSLISTVPAGFLSSGRRRVLGVAMAFVGEPQFIVLDEPTSGMDPFVRRRMWELLKRHRAGRAMCLSTHYMEEAEMLGNQVCILSRGTVQCYGSPDWLKVRLGSGYTLTLAGTQRSNATQANARGALEVLQQAVPPETLTEVVLVSSGTNEAVLRVPFSLSNSLPDLLRTLDGQKSRLGFGSLLVSATTLEELFLRLADGEGEADKLVTSSGKRSTKSYGLGEEAHDAHKSYKHNMSQSSASSLEELLFELASAPPPRATRLRQVVALILKRLQAVGRNKKSLLCMCFLPVSFNVLGIASIATTFELNSPPLELLSTARNVMMPRFLVPYTVGSHAPFSLQDRRVQGLLDAGISSGVWDATKYIAPNRSLQRVRPPFNWHEDFHISFGVSQATSGPRDDSPGFFKYENMRQKGAPTFVIQKVMENDGISTSQISAFLDGNGGRIDADVGGFRVQVSLEFGRDSLLVDEHRTAMQREELAVCTTGGRGRAALVEEAVGRLDTEMRGSLEAMQQGGAPAFAQRAHLEGAGVPAEDVDILTALVSPEAVPLDQARALHRCAQWQAFAQSLLDSRNMQGTSQCGALHLEDVQPFSSSVTAAVLYNGTVPHSAPLLLASFQRAAVAMGSTSTPKSVQEVKVVNWPLPLTEYQRRKAFSTQGFSFFTMSLIGVSFLPASIMVDVVQEFAIGVVRQQIVAGMSAEVFVLAGFMADVVLILPPLLTQVLFVQVFELAVFIDCLDVVAVLLILFAFASVAQVYAILPHCQNPIRAQNAMLALNFVTGFVLSFIVWLLSIPFLGDTANTMSRTIAVLGRWSPAFNLANALLTIPNTSLVGFSNLAGKDVLDWHVAGEPTFALMVNCIVYLGIAYWQGLGPGAKAANTCMTEAVALVALPPEVQDEQRAVKELLQGRGDQTRSNERGLLLWEVAVGFGTSHAAMGEFCLPTARRAVATQVTSANWRVGPISLIVPRHGVLGVLGVSGCGKSALLAALAGALPSNAIVSGGVFLDGKLVTCSQRERGEVGYCPQEDQLSHGLTTYEHLQLFGRLRGLRGRSLEVEVSGLMRALDLELFEETRSENLSGGNKRKLQCACALVASPKLMCLDEPSAGLDPVGRRSLWRTLQAKLASVCVAVIATKSVDEAEALCSKLAILARDGRVSTIGSVFETRSRYGGGHELRVQLRRPLVTEVYDAMMEKRDSKALSNFLRSAVQAFGATVVDDGALRSFAVSWIEQAEASQRTYENLLQALQGMKWAAGLPDGMDVGANKEFLSEDSVEMQSELRVRSQRILTELRVLFPGMKCVEAVSLVRSYHLHDKEAPGGTAVTGAQPSWSIADVFQSIEDRKGRLRIADYSITQTSLEHVFNSFARQDNQEGTSP